MKPPFDFIYVFLVMTFVVAKIPIALSNPALWRSSKLLSFYPLLFFGSGVMLVLSSLCISFTLEPKPGPSTLAVTLPQPRVLRYR